MASGEFESGGPPTCLGLAPWAPPPAGPRAAVAESGLGWQVAEVLGALGEDGPPVQRLERKGGETGAGHRSLTWPPASSVFHACKRSELPGALLRGRGLAGCGESWSAREGGGGTQKWVGGKTSPPSHHEGTAARSAPGGRDKARARRPGATCPPAARSPLGPRGRPLGAGGNSASKQPLQARTLSQPRHRRSLPAPPTRKLRNREKV